MFIEGDYVKIKNKEVYSGEYGKIIGYDGQFFYTIQLIKTKKSILCEENQIEKVSSKHIKSKEKFKTTSEFQDSIHDFDINNEYQETIQRVNEKFQEFQRIFPFKENPHEIDSLKADDLYKIDFNEYGDFFHWIVHELKDHGKIDFYPQVYIEASKNLEEFKDLLYTTVDPEIALAEKVDAQWEKISGMGRDKILAKKIICCFDNNLLPIFSTNHLEHFVRKLYITVGYPSDYEGWTLGEKYEFLTTKLLEVKESLKESKNWGTIRFMRFLYYNYSPPR